MTSTAPNPLLDPRRPFSRADARAAGIPLATLLSKRFHKVCYDAYVSSAVPITTTIRATAALQVSPPGSHLSHHSAVELWGGVAPVTPDVHVTSKTAYGRTVRRGITAHVASADATTTQLEGLRISTPSRAFLELAAVGVDLVDLVIAGDSLVKAKRTTPAELEKVAGSYRGRGARIARRAAQFVRSGVDSPMDTRLRLLIVLAGLPEPQVNVIVRDDLGHWIRRYDLCYPDLRLIVEYDGRQHAESIEQWERDLVRREHLDQISWRILVVTSRGIYQVPSETLDRVRAALRACGATGIRTSLNPEWKRHFPGR